MAKVAQNIREDLFQKSHAEGMQALIWALALLKQKKGYLSAKEKQEISALANSHQAIFDKEPALAEAFKAVQRNLNDYKESEIKQAIDTLRLKEKAYQEDLERKASRHKLSLFFAFFFAVGCGTTVAGSNFLMGAEYGWTANMGFLLSIAATALPIVGCVALANWWMVVRLVPDIENANKDPYEKVRLAMIKLFGKRLGEYSRYNAWLYSIGIFFYELWNALAYNFKQTEEEKQEANNRTAMDTAKLYFWRTVVFFGAVIYAFFAYAATFKLGMGIHELFNPNAITNGGLAYAGSWGLPTIASAIAGVFMAIPTYMAMKTLYIRMATVWMDKVKGSSAIVENIPGAKSRQRWWLGMPLLFWFKFAATAIIISIAFTTYAATDPLGAFFQGMGMAANIATPLAIVTVATAFVGNIPFYWHCAASTFAQHFDPRERLNSTNSKLFPYIRFWNALLNSIPVLVGVLAVFSVIGLSGPAAPLVMFLPIVLNVLVGAVASYGANCGGSKTMYQFDPAKQISKYQLAQLDAMSFDQRVAPPKELNGDDHLCAEYFGAYQYMLEGKATAQMPRLATVLRNLVLNDTKKHPVTPDDNKLVYQALKGSVATRLTQPFVRAFSAVFHGNVRYIKNLFPVDYLNRIETYASEEARGRLYEAALQGGESETRAYHDLLTSGASISNIPNLSSGAPAELFWKAYGTKNAAIQQAVMNKIINSTAYNADTQALLMQHSKPELRVNLLNNSTPYNAYNLFCDNNFYALNFPRSSSVANYLAFPALLIADAVKGAWGYLKKALRIPSGSAKALDQYSFLTQEADDKTRTQYLIDVLSGYAAAEQSATKMSVARDLIKVLINLGTAEFTPDHFDELGSGVIGLVFEIASTIPEIKERLKAALDQAVVQEAKAPPLSYMSLTPDSPQHSQSKGLFTWRRRSAYTMLPLTDDEMPNDRISGNIAGSPT